MFDPALRRRFWPEIALAVVSAALAALTLVWRDWIERVFGVDPDRGSGALEWSIVVALLLLAVVFAALARAEVRRASPNPS
jgi:hypothetical protein